MNHPTSEAAAKVASVFRFMSKQEGHIVDMGAWTIYTMNTALANGMFDCKTVGCHGGEYLLGCYMIDNCVEWGRPEELLSGRKIRRLKTQDEDEKDLMTDGAATMFEGAQLMARTLGFPTVGKLEEWANENPDIWGAKRGGLMFSSESAFGLEPYSDRARSELTNGYLADWWEAIEARLKEREEKAAKKVAHIAPHPLTMLPPQQMGRVGKKLA